MPARRDDTEQTHNAQRAIHYDTDNIQKSKGLSNHVAATNQIKHVYILTHKHRHLSLRTWAARGRPTEGVGDWGGWVCVGGGSYTEVFFLFIIWTISRFAAAILTEIKWDIFQEIPRN